MFREIQSQTFYAQTVGRILRMAEPEKSEDYINIPDLRTGFLYTNYRRDEIKDIKEVTGNKPETNFSYIRKGFEKEIDEFSLPSEFIHRVDYGDIADSAKFQMSFAKSFNEYFGITEGDVFDKIQERLCSRGLEIKRHVDTTLVVDAKFEDFDKMSLEFRKKGHDYSHEMSENDVEKLFNYFCYKVLTEQTDEDAKISNVARSWNRLKSALRVWNKNTLSFTGIEFYKIFINDMLRDARSSFRPAITKALKDYKPILKRVLDDKKMRIEQQNSPVFRFKPSYAFTDDYETIKQNQCILDPCYIKKEYIGRENEERFIRYIDASGRIEWWFKNGDVGKDYFALKYSNTREQKDSLFYPDWIIKLSNGKIGIFDTKTGMSLNTEGRAKGLAKKLKELGENCIGGIVRYANGVFEYCNSVEYNDQSDRKNKWEKLSDIL
jgi:type III restriction enzyme